MERVFTEDDYIRCDIVTGRLYRLLTSLFQDFLEVQLSEALGSQWINAVVKLADNISGKDMSQERNSLRVLLRKRDEKGLVLMDKTCIDVTIANTLMLFTCYYLVSVPRYNGFSKDEMIDIIHTYENKPASEYTNFDMAGLQEKLLECINKDIRVVLKCQEKMAVPIKRNGKDDKKKNGKIEADDFYKKIQRLVDNKNRLNSHMSTVSDPIASEREITDTIMNLEEFLDYLTAAWEYEMKCELLEKYRKELNIIRYLRSTTKFADVISALNSVIDTMPVEKKEGEEEGKEENPGGESNEEEHLKVFTRCFSLLSNTNNHCAACTALMVESNTLENPCATIMLAFMYYCGWADGRTAEEILMQLFFIDNQKTWLAIAENLNMLSKNEERIDKEQSVIHRAQAVAYYIGHAMVNKASSAFMMAGYLGIMLENFEITKACFRFAGESDQKAQNYYNAFSNMRDEATFQKWAEEQNRRRLNE